MAPDLALAGDTALAADLAGRLARAAAELALERRTDRAHPGQLDPERSDPTAGTYAIRRKGRARQELPRKKAAARMDWRPEPSPAAWPPETELQPKRQSILVRG